MKKGPPSLSKRAPTSAADTELLAIQALTFICGNPEYAERFMALCGITPGALRRAAAEPGFLLGVMDYLVGDEPLLVSFAEHAGLSPEAVVAAHQRLGRGSGFDPQD